jgi:sulfhydrogenase subunit beta (sulfur reductase)
MDKILQKKDLGKFVENLKKDHEVIGPKRKAEGYIFDYIDDSGELALDYTTTMLPPKKIFFPPREPLYSYEKVGEEVVIKDLSEKWKKKRILFGVHSCDINALLILDGVFGGKLKDQLYLNRRRNTLIIGMNCRSPGENCFCDAMTTGPTIKKGYDLLLTDIGDKYYVQVGSKAGEKLLSRDLFRTATKADRKKMEAEVIRVKNKLQSDFGIDKLGEKMKGKFWSKLWEAQTKKCVLCGACNFVCPTCYCFDVVDETDLAGKKGQRVRVWDTCHFKDFATVAGGINFRGGKVPRVKQRLYHKLCYSTEQRGVYDCVGCGRCIQFCPAKIDIREIIKDVQGETT